MPLPQQVVDRLSRESVTTPGWSGRLLMFAGTIFFTTLTVYLGLVFGYKPYLNSQINQLDDQIKKFTQKIPISEQEKLIVFYSQLINLNTILHQRPVPSPVFDWLEKNTQANIFYTRFTMTTATGELSLNGIAKTVDDFVQQLQVFQSEPAVRRFTVNTVTTSANGNAQFDVVLFFNPDFFSQSASAQ